jgi:predicted alpha/beta-hydrolase family hydrolase
MPCKTFSIVVPELGFSVSGLWMLPQKAEAALVLAHGAGAGMNHPHMEALSLALEERKIATLRFQFGYMEQGKKRPDTPPQAMAAIGAAVKKARKLSGSLPLFAGGKSFGGRMTTNAAASGKISEIQGILCFGFPLHPPKKPSITRAEHLAKITVPTLFIQGTRDDLADLLLLKNVLKKYPKLFQLHIVDGADHSFSVLKSSGRTNKDALFEVADASLSFVKSLS